MEREKESWHLKLPSWAQYVLLGLITLPAVEFMVIVALIFWRILFGIYAADTAQFVDVINTFGSSFVNSIAFGAGAGGAFGLLRSLPKLMSRFKAEDPSR